MTKINVVQFNGYDAAALLQYLQLEGSPVVEVILPRITEAESMKENVLYEYYMACMAGEVLSRLCAELMFMIPPVDTGTTFEFILIEPRFEELALFLEKAAAGYQNMRELDLFFDYVSAQTEGLDPEKKLVCETLIVVSEEYYE